MLADQESAMGKGSQTTTTQSSNAPDPQAYAAYSQLLQRAAGVASTPYQAYSGELTSPVNSQQYTGIAGINDASNLASPYIQGAAGLATSSVAPVTGQQINQYLNPYTQDVVNATQAQMANQNAQAMAGLQGNQIAQGALGGNATGVAKGILAGQQSLNNNNTIANLYSQGYSQALGAAQQQQQTGLAGANALANYGIQGQNAALTGANAQLQAGGLLQQTQQAEDTARYNQYLQAQAYPYQQTQWLAGIDTGVGSQLGGTSNGSTTGPAPNQTAQWLGLGLTGAGLFLSDGGAVSSRGLGDAHYNAGGPVHRASGGVSGMPWGDAQGWIPTIGIRGGAGAPQPHAPSPASTPQPSAQDWSKIATGVTGFGNKLSGPAWGGGNFFSGDAYGGSSSNPLPGLTAADYGEGFARGGGVAGYADGGAPDYTDPGWFNPDVGPGVDPSQVDTFGDANRAAGTDKLIMGMTEPMRMPPPEATREWRANTPIGKGPDSPVEPVVAADDEEGGETAPAAAGRSRGVAGPAMAYQGVAGPPPSLPSAITNPSAPHQDDSSGFGLGYLNRNQKAGLLAAGLGMLANRSPFLGVAVGEGGLAGLSAYGAGIENDRKAQQEVEKLQREAHKEQFDEWLKSTQAGETHRHNVATEEKEFKPQLIHHPDPATGQEVYGTYDPNTKTIKPLEFPSTGDTKAERYVSQAPPVEERRRAPAASPEARDEGYLQWLEQHRPPGYADIVRGVADYEMDPNRVESLQKGQRSQLYRDAKLYDPTYDQTHFGEKVGVINSFSRGADRAAVNSLNVSVSHLASLEQLGAALNNGQFPLVNRIFNQLGVQMGGHQVTDFNAAKEIVGDEVVKAIVGGVSAQADRDAIKHLIMAQQSPAQLQGTIKTFTDLLAGQLEGRRTGYQAGTGLNNFDQKYLSPEAREALTRVRVTGGHVDPSVTRMVWPSGIPQPQQGAPGTSSGFQPPAQRVRQNGRIFELQPDGSYKAVR